MSEGKEGSEGREGERLGTDKWRVGESHCSFFFKGKLFWTAVCPFKVVRRRRRRSQSQSQSHNTFCVSLP